MEADGPLFTDKAPSSMTFTDAGNGHVPTVSELDRLAQGTVGLRGPAPVFRAPRGGRGVQTSQKSQHTREEDKQGRGRECGGWALLVETPSPHFPQVTGWSRRVPP